MLAALTIFLSSTLAHATNGDSQPFLLSTEVEAWPVTDIDSGWWPEEGPVRVRTVLFAEGLAVVDIEGNSIVERKTNGATQRLDQDSALGEAGIELSVAASLYLSIDVAGYTWEDVLHEQTVDFDVSQAFESFAFTEDGGADLNLPMDEVDVFEIDQGILPMVNVVVSGSLSPDATMRITTEAIETTEGTFTANGQRVETSGGSVDLDAEGTLVSELNMLIQGHAEVCITWVNCYGDFNYDFELDPIEHTQDLAYDTNTISHAVMTGGPSNRNGFESDDDTDSSDASTGGCSTAPAHTPPTVWMVVLLSALVARRSRSTTESESTPNRLS